MAQTKLPHREATKQKKACDRIRTGDPFLTKEVLYLLSYTSIKAGDEVRTRDP